MATTRRDVAIRLSGEGLKATGDGLVRVGDRGANALKRLEEAARPTSRALVAVDRASGELRARAEGMAGALGGVGTVLRGLGPAGLAAAAGLGGGVVALTALTRLAGEAIRSLSSIGDVADRLGLTAEALQELRFAAEQNNVAAGQADIAFQRFTRRLGEAQNGGGDLLKVFEQYNIQLKNIDGSNRTSIQVFRDFADAVKNVKDPQEQLRLAFKAFDSEGAKLVRLLRQGSEGFDGYARSARATGAVIDNEVVARAIAAGDRINALEQRQQVALDTIGEVFSGWAEGWAEAKTTVLQSIAAIVDSMNELDRRSSAGLASTATTLQARLESEREGRARLASRNPAGLAAADRRIRQTEAELEALALEQLRRIQPPATAEPSGAGGVETESERKTREEREKAAEKERQQLLTRGLAIQRQVQTAGEKYQTTVAELNQLQKAGAIDAATFGRANAEAFKALLEGAGDAQAALGAFGDEARTISGQIEDAWAETAKAMTAEFRSFLQTGEFNFGRFLDGIVGKLIDAQLDKLLGGSGGILDGIGSALGSFFASLFAPAPTGPGTVAGGTLFFHDGGTVGRDGRAMRPVDPAVFAGAPRYHGGGLLPGERPIIAQDGEVILNQAQQRNVAQGLTGGGELRIVIQNETGGGSKVEASQGRGADGMREVRLLVRDQMLDLLADGSFDRPMSSHFGLSRQGN